MPFTNKDWQNSPSTATPISAESQEDQETRLGNYVDQIGANTPFIEYGWAPGSWMRTMSNADRAADLAGMAATGAKWVRVEADQWAVQGTNSSTFDWTALDHFVTTAEACSLKVLLMPAVTPPWAGTAGWYKPTSNATYGTWVTNVVNRYKPGGTLGTNVVAYEMWNEPNLPSFWLTGPNAAEYAALLTAGYDAAKAAFPGCIVITAGTAPAATSGTSPTNTISPTDFLAGIYSAGAGAKFDAVGHHPYCSPAWPGEAQSWSAWYQMYGTSPSLRSIMVAQNQGTKKIWATEYGTFTNGPAGDAGAVQTEAAQAGHTATAMELWRNYDWAGPLLVYEYRDMDTSDGGIDGNDATTRENHFGHALHTDRTTKPAGKTFTSLATSAPVPLSGSVAYTAAAIAAHSASATQTITVQGAAVGDYVMATHSSATNQDGIKVWGWVSAANTVSVHLRNHTAGSLTPGSGTIRVMVVKQLAA